MKKVFSIGIKLHNNNLKLVSYTYTRKKHNNNILAKSEMGVEVKIDSIIFFIY